MRLSRHIKNRAIPALSWLMIVGGLSIALWFGFVSTNSSDVNSRRATDTISTSHRNYKSPTPGVIIRNIEDFRVGDRVLAHNPELSDADRDEPDPDPATWRKLDLAITNNHGYRLDIALLRPLGWLEERQVVLGGKLVLDIPEMNAYGDATVQNVNPCPPINSGDGRVVIGTFRHTSGNIVDIGVSGLDKPIGTTADHPFWSEDRQDFIAAGKLNLGEQILAHSGFTHEITSITRRGPPEPVYNLEVHGEHVYHVSSLGVLVHNYGPSADDEAVVTLKFDSRMRSKFEFMRKARELEQLGGEGLLIKSKPSERVISTADLKNQMIRRIYGQYHSQNPEFATALIERVRRSQYDHLHELQLGGRDAMSNLRLLDTFTNWHIGTQQITQQLRAVPYGTRVRIKIIDE